MKNSKQIIVECMKLLNPNSVLDLGCGKCKFSKRFIEQGIDVIGVDKDKTAESRENLKFFQEDIKDFNFKRKYDLIIGTGILHFLKKEEASSIIEKMKENTSEGGFNFLICMSHEENRVNEIYFYPKREELSKLYSGWEIIKNESCLSKKHGEDPHQHKIIIFLAKKS